MESLQNRPPEVTENDPMGNDSHRRIFLDFVHQLDQMSIDESLHSSAHGLYALHLNKARLIAASL
jgi:hypothetical protein